MPHPDGSELLRDVSTLTQAAAELWDRNPSLCRIVIKLNEGFSGEGNAILALDTTLSSAPLAHKISYITAQLPHITFESATESWDHYSARIPDLGAIVEAFIEGENKRSPSVQGQINPDGTVEILSTHDQILGGPSQQIYLGCHFPADASYRLAIQNYGRQVGEYLGS